MELNQHRRLPAFSRSAPAFGLLLALVVAGFWSSYFSRLLAGHGPLIHVHAVAMVVWCGLLILQPMLIQRGQRALHRTVGRLSILLLPLLAWTMLRVSQQGLQVDGALQDSERLAFAFVPLGMMTLFLLSWTLAIIHRRDPARHARYMVGTGLALIDPALARLLFQTLPPVPFPGELIGFTVINLLLLVLIWLERDHKRGREVFPILLGLFVAFDIGVFTLARSEGWARFATWFAGIPLG